MERKRIIYYFLLLIIFSFFFQVIKSEKSYEIHLNFQSKGLQSLYCDDDIQFFGTNKIIFYKLKETIKDYNTEGIISPYSSNERELIMPLSIKQNSSLYHCSNQIKYYITSENTNIIIEFKDNPKTLERLFLDSSFSRLERFDYPFPLNERNYNEMFYRCTELTYANFSKFSFEKTADVSSMFNNCTKLKTVIFPQNSKSSNIESFKEMFSYSGSLTSIDLTYFSFVKTKNMGYMFNGCYNLKYINFPKNEKAENIQFLYGMFEYCSNLISVDLSYFSFKNVEDMGYMFRKCNRLSTLILPKEKNKSTALQDVFEMFYDCNELTSIDLSGISFLNVKDLRFMFYGCYNLETLILPSNEKASNVVNFGGMFFDCRKLKSIDLSNISFINTESLALMFANCTNLIDIKFPTEEKATNIIDFQCMFALCQSLTSIDLSNFSFENAKDLRGMFLYCSNLEHLILPKNEIVTNIEDISYMFKDCNKLRAIDLSGISLINLIDISYIFANCSNLESIIFTNDGRPINKIEQISHAFYNCYKLKSIDLSKFNLSLVTNLDYMFYSCSNLETIKLPEQKINNVESFSHTFHNCSKLKTIDLMNISFLKAKNISFMFANCSDLLEIKFDFNEQAKNINNMNGTFANCTSINSIDISHIHINNNAILDNLFFNCFSLKEINLFNIDTTKSNSTFNFINNDYLEKCLYYNLDHIHLNKSSVFKACSKSIFLHKCGSCINTDNLDEYCTIIVNNKNLNFYYFKSELNLSITEKQCLWTNNYENFGNYAFINNSIINSYSYFEIYCNYYCEICSDNEYGCLKCKNHFYPENTEYIKYTNNEISYFYCYEKMKMKNYFFDDEKQQFIKCSEKCNECLKGVDICNECNEEKSYYPVENIKNECWKEPPAKNYCFDSDVNQWRKCNERCSQCLKQVKSEIDHQCLECSNNYYPYLIDYQNFRNLNLTGFNCWLISEVKLKNKNYFLNNLNQFEQCDISCAECETKKDNCLECQINYYYIKDHKNGTCFSNPLRKYALVNINDENVFLSCFHLCESCNQISQSFLYQQCSKCDEIDYTLDEYSLNKSYCIPKDKSHSYLIKYQTKWYIKDFKGIENLTIENENMVLDYQRVLNDEIFYNLEYEVVNGEECPADKPYVIYSTRQCVKSCYSNNLIEFGIFMIKKLYIYNKICYDKCPYGSIEDNETFSCIEINKYLINQAITLDFFKNNKSYENRMEYLGDGYAKETIQFIRAPDFSNYLSNETYDPDYDEEELIKKKKEMKMPIYNFSECIFKIKKYYNFNESENIFSEIIEYNDVVYKNGKKNPNVILNSTSFRLFLNNGSIINHSICYGSDINISKPVNNINFNLSLVEQIKEKTGIDIFEDNDRIYNYCEPILIDGKSYPVKSRKNLIEKNKKPCDDGCSFISFDFKTNYSTCKCKILNEEENDIISETKEQIEKMELIENTKELIQDGNLKYLTCYKIYIEINKSYLYITHVLYPLIIAILFILEIILFVIFFLKNYRKTANIYINKKREVKSGNINNISEKTHLIINVSNYNNDEMLISENYTSARKEFSIYDNNLIKYYFRTYWTYLKNKVIIFIFIKNRKSEFNSVAFKIIKIIIFVLNYLFITALLFNDNYISLRIIIKEKELEYILTKEFRRIILVFIIAQFINKIIFFFFNAKERLEENEEYLKNGINTQEYFKQLDYLKYCFKIKFIIGFIFILIFHITIIYYFIIFTYIYRNINLSLFFYFLLTIFLYIIFHFISLLIVVSIRLISLKFQKDILFNISIYMADAFEIL